MKVHARHQGRVRRGHRLGVRVTVSPAAGGDQQVLEADKLLSAIGFAPRIEGYGLESRRRRADRPRRHRRSTSDCRTNVPERLRHRRRHRQAHARPRRPRRMGVVAAETIAGAETMEIDFDMIPRATFCQPQIALVRLLRGAGQGEGLRRQDRRRSRSPPTARRCGMAEGVGFVKIVADAEHNEILGAHLIGPEVTELLPALTLAQQWDLTADEVARNVFAHPTPQRGHEGGRRGHRRPHDQPLRPSLQRMPLGSVLVDCALPAGQRRQQMALPRSSVQSPPCPTPAWALHQRGWAPAARVISALERAPWPRTQSGALHPERAPNKHHRRQLLLPALSSPLHSVPGARRGRRSDGSALSGPVSTRRCAVRGLGRPPGRDFRGVD